MGTLKHYRVEGSDFDAFNENDATIKNNTLAVNTAENMAVPSGSVVVLLSTDQDVWYSLSGTAAIPTDDTTNHSYLPGGTLDHPIMLNDVSITNISLLSASVCHVVGKFFD